MESSLNNCPSASSIFYIGEGDSEAEDTTAVEEVEEEVGSAGNNGQELFAQAETFIGNFYKQLKMQKEESWKNIHGFYQKHFWPFLFSSFLFFFDPSKLFGI